MSQRLVLLLALMAPLRCLGFVPKEAKGASANPPLEAEKASGGNGPTEVRPVLPRYVFFMLQAHQGPGSKGQRVSDAYQRFHIDPYIQIFGKRPYFATADAVWAKKKRRAAPRMDSYQTQDSVYAYPATAVRRRPYRAGITIYPHRGGMNAYQEAMDPYRDTMNPYRYTMDPYRDTMDPYRDTVYAYQNGLTAKVDTADLRKDSVFMDDVPDPAVATSSNVSSDGDARGNGSVRLDKRKGDPDIPVASDIPRHPRSRKRYDVPQIECPTTPDGSERFACPSADNFNRYRCIDDHGLCDGFIDCPKGEDEDMRSCMFYKTTKAHLDVLADALLRWARGRY